MSDNHAPDQNLSGQSSRTVQPDDSEPEPDAAIVPAGDYDHAHPTTALLVIEIADSSLARDRRKAGLYAAAGIPECWIVDRPLGWSRSTAGRAPLPRCPQRQDPTGRHHECTVADGRTKPERTHVRP